jgi:hypothetical protein
MKIFTYLLALGFSLLALIGCKPTQSSSSGSGVDAQTIVEPLGSFRPTFSYSAEANQQTAPIKTDTQNPIIPSIKTVAALPLPPSETALVDTLAKNLATNNSSNKREVLGYRIQIFSSNDRFEAEEIKSKAHILRSRMGLNPELVYDQPIYRVQVGYYISRAEALSDLLKVRKEYPTATLINETLPLHRLRNKYK